MATLASKSLIQGMRGMLGGLVFRTVGDRTIVSYRPSFPRSRKESPLQHLNRSRFRDASRYAHAMMRDKAKKEYYWQKARQMKLPNAYTAAITDFMRNIRIQSIDPGQHTGNGGGKIVIEAHKKNFAVDQVNVTIATKAGLEIETGKAVRNASGKWIYKCVNITDQKELVIIAGAMDHLGKTTFAKHISGDKPFAYYEHDRNLTPPRWFIT